MAHEFKMVRTVEFADTDMAGILHFSNYFRYMEVAEHEFFRSLGMSVHSGGETGAWGWARGKAECSYRAPLRYEDRVEVHLLVREKRTRSIRYEFRFHKLVDGAEPVEVAHGSLTVVCVAKPTGEGPLLAVDIPEDVDAALQVALVS